MNKFKGAISAVALAAPLAFAGVPATQAQSGIEIGVLDCSVEGGVGLIITSKKDMRCLYKPAGGGAPEPYIGTIRKFGLDIGATGEARIIWTVVAPSADIGPGSLAGTYGGASAEVSAGIGVGANALIGGFERSFALQPLSLQGQTGLNVAAGVTRMELVAAQ